MQQEKPSLTRRSQWGLFECRIGRKCWVIELGIDYELKKKGLSNSPKSLILLMASPRGFEPLSPA